MKLNQDVKKRDPKKKKKYKKTITSYILRRETMPPEGLETRNNDNIYGAIELKFVFVSSFLPFYLWFLVPFHFSLEETSAKISFSRLMVIV